jgi:hypothetical protein
VRRIVVLLVLALVGAAAFGLGGFSSGIKVNASSISGDTFRSELVAISTNPAIDCYMTALDPVNFAPGAGGTTMAASGAAAWANLRIEGIAITQYVTAHLKYRPTAAGLALAKSSLEGEMTQAATAASYTCPESAAGTLADTPTEMRNAQVGAQAASLYLVSKLNSTVPLTVASMKTYFAAHASDFDTICVSIALVDPTKLASFASARKSGESVAALAKKFSADPSGAKGGAYGCYAPTSKSYASVRTDVASTALNTFPTTPQYVSYNSATYALFVAPTKRTPATFAQAAGTVLADLKNLNATAANAQKEKILFYYSAVAVDPAFGRWGLNSTGPSVFAPATPAAGDVNSSKSLTSPSATPYK